MKLEHVFMKCLRKTTKLFEMQKFHSVNINFILTEFEYLIEKKK